MKILLTILLSLLLIGGFSQQIPNGNPITNAPNSWVSYGYTRDSGKIFIVRDTFNARYPTVVMRPDGILWKTLGNGAYWYMVGSSAIDTLHSLVTHTALNDSLLRYLKDTVFCHYDTVFWERGGSTYYIRVDTFSSNPTLYGANFGKYVAGNTPNWKGLSSREAIIDAITQCNHPNYISPTVTINSSTSFGSYEYGTNLGSITLSNTFVPNNGGSDTANVYYQNSSALGGNTTTISSLTSTQYFYVNSAYQQGACIANNCGTIDCYGRINAGNVNSGTSSYSVGYRRYYGWISDTTGITTGGQDAAIRAVIDSTQFSVSASFGSSLSPINTGNPPSGSAYYIFGYVSTSPTMSDIVINGTPLGINAFNVNTRSTFTNSQGVTLPIRVYYNKNKQYGSFSVYTTSN